MNQIQEVSIITLFSDPFAICLAVSYFQRASIVGDLFFDLFEIVQFSEGPNYTQQCLQSNTSWQP